MTGWSSGYVTDVAYMSGYYPQQSPRAMAVSALLNGVATDILDGGGLDRVGLDSRGSGIGETLSYLEVGSGQGFGAIALAASNPGWRVTAVDFNPGHVAHARRYASDAGVANITFLEADLAALTDDQFAAMIPEADVVSLHGVWSWVAPNVRAGIVRLLRGRVRAGGLVHVSYNAAPAWQGAIALQRIIREFGTRLATRSDRQASAGLGIARELHAAKAMGIAPSPFAEHILQRLATLSPEYLAHEYMNESWTPCFHADVADALADARLDYVGSVELTENIADLMLTEPQRALYDRFDDPRLRELIKDVCIGRGLRHDLYVRGARRLGKNVRDAALCNLTVALSVPPEQFRYEVDMPVGKATLGAAFYKPVVQALTHGPRRIGDLLDMPQLAGRRDNPPELVAMLVGTDQAVVVARPDAASDAASVRFNAVTARRMFRPDQWGIGVALAAPRLGAGLPCSTIDLFLVDRVRAAGGAVDPDALLLELGPQVPEEKRDELRAAFARGLDLHLPLWHTAGII